MNHRYLYEQKPAVPPNTLSILMTLHVVFYNEADGEMLHVCRCEQVQAANDASGKPLFKS